MHQFSVSKLSGRTQNRPQKANSKNIRRFPVGIVFRKIGIDLEKNSNS